MVPSSRRTTRRVVGFPPMPAPALRPTVHAMASRSPSRGERERRSTVRNLRPMRALIPATVAALATVLVVATPGGAAPPGPIDVIVRNATANPVPVAQQGTASVNVTNSSLPVTQVGDVPARQYQDCQSVFLPSGVITAFKHFAAVPAGRRLVVKHASVYAQLPSGQVPQARVAGLLDGVGFDMYIPMSEQGTALTADVYNGSEEILG